MGKPKIRFEGYSEDWEQRKLDDVLKRRIEQRQQSEEYPRLAFASGQGVIPLSERKTNNREQLTKDEYTKKYLVTELNDIVYNPANVKYGAIDRNKCGRGVISPIYVTFTTNEVPGFIERIVTSHDFQQRALRFEEGTVTKRQSVNPEDLVTLDILVAPKREEQQKIATYFDALDHLITLHQRKYDETKTLKKYMLQKMFPQNGEKVPEIRFDGFTEDWEQRKLGEVCEIKDSARIPNSEWSESGIPYIRASDVTNENTDGVLFISQERYEFYKNRTGAPTKNDVLFNGGGEIGKSLLITDEKPIYVQGGAVLYARTSKSRELVGQYLKTYFETTNAKSYIDAASAGGTMRHFTLKPSQKMRILMPSVEEQEKIGGYFVNLDRLITLHQRKCNELKEIKKYMLQNMFV
ncbi:restriction endonuclease subunit S [Coprococcus comes]|uniref:restriction endonuclease subunit S n=1 Tax=Coprococcus comes TaxID=410072 RepID=UPI001899DC25|nr:restriction endonuclease subunit S [Coprococcus comes]